MRDTTIFIVCASIIAIVALVKGHVTDVDNIINVIIGAMAGCAVGYSYGSEKNKKHVDNQG